MEVVFFRCFTAMVVALGFLRARKIDWKGSNRKLLFLRGLFGTMALYTFFLTIQNIPLASAVTIQYLSPIFTTVIAVFLLGEKVKIFQWTFFAISFSGVVLMHQSDERISTEFLLIGFSSALFSAFAYNMVRSLRAKENELVVVLHFQIFGAAVGFVLMLFNWLTPTWIDGIYLLLTGIFTHIGQTYLTKSLHRERVANVSILNYTGLVYALIFGFVFFGENFSIITLSSIALVVAGVVLNLVFTASAKDSR